MEYTEKEKELFRIMKKEVMEDTCIAFSGGVDSSLLLKLATTFAKDSVRIYAVTFDTVLHPSCDLAIAERVARETGAVHKILFVDELADPEIRQNPTDRCYRCKKRLFSEMKRFAEEHKVENLMEGTNQDDLSLYRPGLKAVRELGVKSPLAQAGMTKKEVRELAGKFGISVAERPASPCLATRLPYGTEIRPELLRKIEQAEEKIKQEGFPVVRVRVHEETARIEIPEADFPAFLEQRKSITSYLKQAGFHYVTLDLEGFRSGSMDEFLKK